MSQKDGGSALPQPPCPACGTEHAPEYVPGMTLRDYFASASLACLSASEAHGALSRAAVAACVSVEEVTASAAYTLADAMLREREKQLCR